MAKGTKKVSKKTTKIEEHKVAPGIDEGLVSIALLPNDLVTLSNLMAICAENFKSQADAAALANDERQYAVLSARHKLSSMFADRFVEFCNIGEPESRDMH